MKIWLGILLLFLSLPAFAGSKIIGNGGDVYVCDEGKRVISVDLWEAEHLRPLKIADPVGLTYQEKLQSILERIRTRFPKLAGLLAQEVVAFEKMHHMISNAELDDIRDSYHKAGPLDCKREQIANQTDVEHQMWGDYWYLISENLWNLMSELDRAALVLHEVLYRIGLRYGVEHSRGVSLLVGLFFSSDYLSLPEQAWLSGFRESRLPFYEMGPVRIPLFEGGVKECVHVPGTMDCVKEGEPFRASEIAYNSSGAMSTIGYPGKPQTLEWMDNLGLVTQLTTNKVVFVSERNKGLKMNVDGILSIGLGQDPLGGSRFKVNGWFHPRTGFFEGNMLRLTSAGHPIGETFSFSGSLIALLINR